MALNTTPEALHEIAQLHAKIAQLERLSGIRPPGGEASGSEAPPAFAAGLHEIVAGFAEEMVVVCSIGGEILLANHATERVLGYRPSELVGTNAWSYVHPEDLKATATARSAPLDDGIPFENRARAADGSYRWVEFTARRWPREEPTHVIIRFRRAMHREAVQEPDVAFGVSKLHVQLRYAASLARLSQLALGLPLVTDVLDAGATLGASGLGLEVGAWLEPAGADLRVQNETGLGPDVRGVRVPIAASLAGLAFTRRSPTDDSQVSPAFREADALLTTAAAACAIAVPVRGADRVHGVLLLAGRTRRSFEPEDVHFAETVANVLATALDSRAAQEALTKRERLSRAVFDHARDGLVIVDEDGRCVDANAAAHGLLGLPPGALRGRRPSDVAETSLDLSMGTRVTRLSGDAVVKTGSGARSIEYECVPEILPGLCLGILRRGERG